MNKEVWELPIPSQGDTQHLAREWVIYLYSGQATPAATRQWQDWLSSDRENAVAYAKAEQLWRDMAFQDNLDLEDFEKEALAESPNAMGRQQGGSPYLKILTSLAALLILSLGLGLFFSGQEEILPDRRYASQRGEIKTVTLPDGSHITLGGDTVLMARLSETTRQVTLIQGRALFDIETDRDHPFIVQAVKTGIRVVGTVFDVHVIPGGVTVSVDEGIVEVGKLTDAALSTMTAPEKLVRGQKITATTTGDLSPIEEKDRSTWYKGRLNYVHARLEDIVDEVNHYRPVTIELADNDLRDMRLSLTLDISNTDPLLSALEMITPVKITKTPEYIQVQTVDNKE